MLFGATGTWFHGDLLPAGAQASGSPCPGTNGPPLLTSTIPLLGNQGFALDLVSARASTPCVFGLSPRPRDLHLGGGCRLHLGDPILLLPAATNAGGFASLKLGVPRRVAPARTTARQAASCQGSQ